MTELHPKKRDLRLHGKLPRIGHTPHSYSMRIRDTALLRIRSMPFFSGFHFTTNKSVQIQPQSIPFLGVYFMTETSLPDGDANVGDIRFRTSMVLGFSVIVQNNDADKAEYQLDKAYQTITLGLYSDPTFYNNDEFKIQAFMRGMRTHVFGAAGKDNELPIAELRFEMTCDLGVITYEPFVPDMLETIHVTVDQDSGDDQFKVQYDLDQS